MLIDAKSKKEFEKPDSGLFLGVLADIQYVANKMTKFGPKDVARLIWILNAKDSEGNYYRVMTEVNQSMHENSRLYAAIRDIQMGTPPPVPFDPDALIGTVRQLVIAREKSADGTKEFANIKAYIAPTAGQTFAVPSTFIRAKDRPKNGSQYTNSAPVAQATTTASTTANAPAPVASAPVQDEDIPF